MTRTPPPRDKKAWSPAFTAAQKESVRRLGGLLTMELELSRRCDLRCVYCYSEAGVAPEGELAYEEITGAADQAHALGARRIIILGGGEPLIYPRLLDVVAHIRELGTGVELFTNGVAMTPTLARAFREMDVSLVLKMNSPREQVQDDLAGRAGTFRAIRRAFELLGEAGYPGPGARLGAQTVVCRQNLDDLPDMWVGLRERGVVPYFETITLQGRARLHPELAVTPDEVLALFRELSRIDRERFGHVWEARPPIAGYSCDRHEYSCTVTSQGFVQPCPGIDLAVGNIREKPLADILRESPVVAELRDVRRLLKGACGECSEKATCYGCRGMAWQAAGDYLAADPMCPKRAPAAGA